MKNIIIEVCLDSVEAAIAAEQGGANRVELCDNLIEGGTTPSIGSIALARKHINIDLQVIIRPRGGDFCYSDIEFKTMEFDIEQAKAHGVNGVVIGLLKPNGDIDTERTKTLINIAHPMNVTFHRAFDVCRNPWQALEQLIELGVNRILTSGQEPTVLEGLDLISELAKKAEDRIIIMPGCGITTRNVEKIVAQSKVKEIHVVGNALVESPMTYRNANVYMGTELRSPEYQRSMTCSQHIGTFKKILTS